MVVTLLDRNKAQSFVDDWVRTTIDYNIGSSSLDRVFLFRHERGIIATVLTKIMEARQDGLRATVCRVADGAWFELSLSIPSRGS